MSTLVIDKSVFKSPDFEEFFNDDPGNRAVWINIGELESYSGDAVINLSKALSIISRYPKQVLCQKSALELLTIGQIDPAQRSMLIDDQKTQGFEQYCKNVQSAANGDLKMLAYIRNNERNAKNQLSEIIKDSETLILPLIESVKKVATVEGLQAYRDGKPCPAREHRITNEAIYILGQNFFSKVSAFPQLHRVAYLARHYYKFRFAAALWSTAFLRLVEGGANGIRPDKLSNDLLDISYVVSATYYDGIMTNDDRQSKVFNLTASIIHGAFAPPPEWAHAPKPEQEGPGQL